MAFYTSVLILVDCFDRVYDASFSHLRYRDTCYRFYVLDADRGRKCSTLSPATLKNTFTVLKTTWPLTCTLVGKCLKFNASAFTTSSL